MPSNELPGYSQLDRDALLMGAEGEDMHPQKRNLSGTGDEYYKIAVGNNGGTTHPEYYWQTAVYHYRLYVASGKTNPPRSRQPPITWASCSTPFKTPARRRIPTASCTAPPT